MRVHHSAYEATLDFAFVDTGLDTATPVVRIDLPLARQADLIDQLQRARLAWQVEQAMRLPDAAYARLPDGTWAFAGHRRVRDGARVMLVVVPGLMRFDLHRLSDSFSFHVRNLATDSPATLEELGPQPAPPGPDGIPRNEYVLRTRLASGARVHVVAHISPYTGALESENSAVVLIEEP